MVPARPPRGGTRGKMPLQPCADTDQQRLLRSCDRAVRPVFSRHPARRPARQRRARRIYAALYARVYGHRVVHFAASYRIAGARFFCRCQLGAGYSACFRAVFCLTNAADTVRSLRIKTKDGPQGNAIAFPTNMVAIN